MTRWIPARHVRRFTAAAAVATGLALGLPAPAQAIIIINSKIAVGNPEISIAADVGVETGLLRVVVPPVRPTAGAVG